jgi:hypothetical protein
VRHVLRYDVSPLLPRLADDVRCVPLIDASGAVRFADAPRRYLVPVSVQLSFAGEEYQEQVTLVLEKRGIARLDRGIAPDAFRQEGATDDSGPRAAR